MVWTRFSDDIADRLADAGLSRSARLLYVELYAYANRRLLNGRIPLAAVPRVTDSPAWRQELEDLRAADELAIEDGAVHLDWSDQESAEDIERRRGQNRERQRKFARRRAAHAAGDHSLCDSRFCRSVANALGNASSNTVINATPIPSHPIPSPPSPVPKGQGQGEDAEPGRAEGAPDSAHRFIAPADEPEHCAICGHTRDAATHLEIA